MPPASESKAVRKYLSTHAEAEARSPDLPAGPFDHVVVIPSRGEGAGLHRALESVPGSRGGILIVLVLNAGEADDPDRHEANARVRERCTVPSPKEVLDTGGGRSLFLVDRARPGSFLPPKQGVGLARKIGCDVALRLRIEGRIRSRFIHTTDADALLPPDLFERAAPFQDATRDAAPVALLFPFAHVPIDDASMAAAIGLYESALRYHRLGLRAAGSPYAFHTVGSTIAVDHRAYAAVRGFPRKEAGEDFYLLDKLAKFGPVRTLSGDPIRISGRVSDRVPFGTGRALLEFRRGDRSLTAFRLPDPRVFEALGGVLEWLNGLNGDAAGDPAVSALRLWRDKGLDAESIHDVLHSMGAFTAVVPFLDPALDRVRRRSLHTWFDAFRTLRFLHALRDRAFPEIPFTEALRTASFLGDPLKRNLDVPGALEALKRQEESTCTETSAWVGG